MKILVKLLLSNACASICNHTMCLCRKKSRERSSGPMQLILRDCDQQFDNSRGPRKGLLLKAQGRPCDVIISGWECHGPGRSVKTAKMSKSAYGECSKSFGVFWPRVPKESLAPSKPCFAPGETAKKGVSYPCKTVFWSLTPEARKTPFAPSLSTFGRLGCFDSCTRAAESQISGPSSGAYLAEQDRIMWWRLSCWISPVQVLGFCTSLRKWR